MIRSKTDGLLAAGLGVGLTRRRNTDGLVALVTKSRTVLSSFAKAKTAKLGMSLHLSVSPPPPSRLSGC